MYTPGPWQIESFDMDDDGQEQPRETLHPADKRVIERTREIVEQAVGEALSTELDICEWTLATICGMAIEEYMTEEYSVGRGK